MAYITVKEKDDMRLALQLREEGVIKTHGKPFESIDMKEFEGLIANGVFKIDEYDPTKHNNIRIFNSRLVREIKGKGTATPYEKSRLVVQAYNDQGKELILTQSPTLQRASQRLIVVLAPSLMIHSPDIFLWIRDITQAYTQRKTVLERKIYARLPKELNHFYPANFVMRILKPLYGIPELGTHWFMMYFKHHKEAFNMITSTYDPCLLVTNTDKAFGIVRMQTDDTFILANQNFSTMEEKELTFSAKPKEKLATDNLLHFNGCIFNGNVTVVAHKRISRISLYSI